MDLVKGLLMTALGVVVAVFIISVKPNAQWQYANTPTIDPNPQVEEPTVAKTTGLSPTLVNASDEEKVRAALPLFKAAAARCPGLPVALLLAIWRVENQMCFGAPVQTCATSNKGAKGPMQFMPATWQDFGADGDGDGVRDIQNLADASAAAADKLCKQGRGSNTAILKYNASAKYLADVRGHQSRFERLLAPGSGGVRVVMNP